MDIFFKNVIHVINSKNSVMDQIVTLIEIMKGSKSITELF